MNLFYKIFYPICWLVVHIWHPFSKVIGRENIPQGACMICGNHSSMADPFWIGGVLGTKRPMKFMAKKEIMSVPIVGAFCRGMGAYGIDRGGADLAAVKATLTYLKSGTSVIVFPEGTRVRPGKTVEPKTGAAMLAMRAGVPILPVYITQKKRPFCPIRLVFGEPYTPEIAGKRPTAAELEAITADLMERIYRMEAAA